MLQSDHMESSDERMLYGRTICPQVRQIAIGLSEYKLPFKLEIQMSTPEDHSLPVLVEQTANTKQAFSGTYAIMEYVSSAYTTNKLLGYNLQDIGETRRLMQWCNDILYLPITKPLVFERIHKFLWRLGSPDHKRITHLKKQLDYQLVFINDQLQNNTWFATNSFSWADAALAGNISSLDFLGLVSWKKFDDLYCWYLKIKSRASMMTILHEQITGINSSKHYKLIDFDQNVT